MTELGPSSTHSDDEGSFEDAADGELQHKDVVPLEDQASSSGKRESVALLKTVLQPGSEQETAGKGTRVGALREPEIKEAGKVDGGTFAALKARFEGDSHTENNALAKNAPPVTGHPNACSGVANSPQAPEEAEGEATVEFSGLANVGKGESWKEPPPSEGALSLLDPTETISNPFAAATTPALEQVQQLDQAAAPSTLQPNHKRHSASWQAAIMGASSSHGNDDPETPSHPNRFSTVSLSTTLPTSSKRNTVASRAQTPSSHLPSTPPADEQATGSSAFLARNTARLSRVTGGQRQSLGANAEHFKEKLDELRHARSRENSISVRATLDGKRRNSSSSSSSGGGRRGADGHEEDADAQKQEQDGDTTMAHRTDGEALLDAHLADTTDDYDATRRASWDGPPPDEVGEEHIDWDFWGNVMSNYQEIARTRPRELSRAIQAGIPAALRGMMWQLMSSSKDDEMEIIYAYYLKQASSHEKMIRKDLARTFPGQHYFQDGKGIGQENLFNVVKAYSLYDEECGYCQGMQFVVGPLLLNMPDEEAFSTLVRLMKSYDLRGHFIPNMPSLQLRLFQFERLLEECLPLLHRHLVRHGIKSSMYASGWIMTLFTYRSPLSICFRILDSVFAEGIEALFRFALALMQKNEEQLLTMSFDDAVPLLAARVFEVYKKPEADEEMESGGHTPCASERAHKRRTGHSSGPGSTSLDSCEYRVGEFVRDAFQFKITPFMLDSYAADFAEQVKVATAHRREMDALKMDNRALQTRVKSLEDQLGSVQQEHVDLVKSVVMAKLAREEMAEELMRYKMMYAEAALLVDQSGAGQHQQISPSASSAASVRQSH